MEWKGMVGVVTGAASGIGRATALEFARRGATVYGFDIRMDGLQEAAATAGRTSGGRIVPSVTDVSNRTAVAQAVAAIDSKHLDFVVNCAASFVGRGLGAADDDWDLSLGVNVKGISNVVQAAHGHMKRANTAAVVNVASISAHVAQPDRWTYNTSKAAIVGLTRCMAMDLAADGIRANVVSPGWIWTPEVERAANGDRAKWEPIWGRYHLLERFGEASEVATVIAFLCSTDASFVTGTELMVDGGYLAMGPEGMGSASVFASSDGADR